MKMGLAGFAGALMTAAVSQAQEGPQIGDIQWPYISSYCTFMRDGHVFDYNNPDSWVFVFFSELPGEGLDRMNRSFMRIDGQLRELALDSIEAEGAAERRIFHTLGQAPYTVAVVTRPGDAGYEHTDYAGTITVSRGAGSSSVAIKGDCGV